MTKRLFAVICFFLFSGGLILGTVHEARAGETYAPPSLQPWEEWVLYGEEEKACPTYYNDGQKYCCIWPSLLKLSLQQKGGTFEQQWLVLAEGWVPLPGNNDSWPRDVLVNGKKVPVLNRKGTPSIKLESGEYIIKGNFSWAQMPEMINIPPASGILTLAIDGEAVSNPLREKDGRLWLKRTQTTRTVEDRMDVRVFRLVTDSIPMEITTLMKVNVSGKAREISLENVIPDGFVPMNVTSPIPARITSDMKLAVQASPGQWEIYVKARSQSQVNVIGPIKTVYGQEIWAFQPKNEFRMVQIESVSAIDPNQTDSPGEWRQYSTYLIDSDSEIIFKESRRGDSDPSPDRLSLERTWWLDFNGEGFTVRDHITGTMSRQWYLAVNPPMILGRVTLDGADQLITAQGDDKKPGVELRRGDLDMTAESRIDSSGEAYPAVGWDHEFQSLSGTLNLPPGWRLITVSGVDVMPGTWFESWTLLDLFLVLIISLAVFKLWGRVQGLLALVTLILIYHEPGAPKIVWLNLLASLALLRFIPRGWFRSLINFWSIGSILVLLVLSIPFMVQQVRWGIYPQLEPRYGSYVPERMVQQRERVAVESPKVHVSEGITSKGSAVTVEKDVSPSRAKALYELYDIEDIKQADYYSNQAIDVIDKDALNQTGPGIPDWTWRSYTMIWNGPVEKDENIRFWILSPFVNLMLSFVRVVLLVLLILVLLVPGQGKIIGGRLSFISLSIFLLLFIPLTSIAQETDDGFPPDRLLLELKNRLLESPDCLPYCADIPRMEITATADNMQMLLQVHAATDTVIPIPGSMESWFPDQVLLGSGPAKGLMMGNDGSLRLLVRQGTQVVTLTGLIRAANDFQIHLPLTPHKITFSGEGWEIQGIDREGKAESGIKFIRKQEIRDKKEIDSDQTSIPSFFQVERILSLGLDWQVRTRVTRMTATGTAEILSIPLLEGESVTTSGIRVEEGAAHIQIAPDSREIRWDSTLKKGTAITLRSPSFVSWAEVWTLETSTIWHCDFSGIPVIHQQDDDGTYRPQWRPWPGEEVIINVSRPEAIEGQTLTIDKADLSFTPGERSSRALLSLYIRTSKGGQHPVLLPEGARLQGVMIEGREESIRTKDREILLPLQPGGQGIEIEWHQAAGSSILVRSPEVSIGERAVNADIKIEMPQDRWILWTAGPRLGPAVLFWTYLVVIVLAALALGRINWTPLKTRHWLLLGLGLTQVHPILAIMVVGWLLALGQRGKRDLPEGVFRFNAMQILLVVWTVAALVGLYIAIQKGLLGIPNMQISGNGSSDFFLRWTQDRIDTAMPRPSVLSLHLMIFRFLMLAWALWLAYAMLKWLKWGWGCFHEGGIWRNIGRKAEDLDFEYMSTSTTPDDEKAEKQD